MRQQPLPFNPADSDAAAQDLRQAFEAWVASPPRLSGRGRGIHATSIHVYRDMWGSFVDYCVPERPTGSRHVHIDPISALTPQDLQSFLEDTPVRPRNGDLSPRYAWRLLHLIDRVLAFAAARRGQAAPLAARILLDSAPYRHANASAKTPLPQVLSEPEAQALIAHLQAGPPPASSWKLCRDGAAAALLLGAGLSPGEVRALQMQDQDFAMPGDMAPAILRVPADANSPSHEASVAPWARAVLHRWLLTRRTQGIEGPWVFPSTRAGKPWAHPSCHKALVGVLEAAGIAGGAPFRLRHTFAVRQLRAGLPEADVARCLGLADTQALQRYQPWLTTPLPVV